VHHAAHLTALLSLAACGGIAVLEDLEGRGAGSGSGGGYVGVGASTGIAPSANVASVASASGSGGDPGDATAVSSGQGGSSGGGGSPPDPPEITDVFDPAEVYLVGSLIEGECDFGAIAHWSTPNVAVTGLDCDFDGATAQVRPTDGRIVYKRLFEFAVRSLTCDACPYEGEYPTNPSDNDPTSSLAPCEAPGEGAPGFVVSPEGDVFHTCGLSGPWYDEGGNLASFGDPDAWGFKALGFGGLTFTINGLEEWRTGAEVISWPPETDYGTVIAIRAVPPPSAFLLATQSDWEDHPDDAELWTIDLVVGPTRIGAYPPLPAEVEHVQHWTSAIDGGGVLFQLAYASDQRDVIVRREVGGTSEIVYDEADDPLVKAHASFLVTGP
jgi:hypothetical protein